MIKNLTLRNWRGYEKLRVEVPPGLTFVVAENGTGKTSLVHGAIWALFGESAGIDAESSRRLHSEPVDAELSVTLAGEDYTVTRTWPSERRGAPSVSCVDAAGHSRDLDTVVRSALGLALPTVRDLWFVPEMRLATEAAIFTDVGRHLRNLLGIDSVEAVATRANAVEISARKQASKLKQEATLSQHRRSDVGSRLTQLDAELEAIDAALSTAEGRRMALRAELDAAKRWDRYEHDDQTYNAAFVALQARLDELGGGDLDELAGSVAQHEADVDSQIATLQAEAEILEGLSAQLATAGGNCPVCLQSLSREDAAAARRHHADHLSQLRSNVAALQRDRAELRQRNNAIRAVTRDFIALQRPAQPTEPRARPTESVSNELDLLDIEIGELNRRRGGITREAEDHRASLRADDSIAADIELARSAFAQEAAAKVLHEVADATARDRDAQGLAPLAKAVRAQWSQFFPRRGAPSLTGDDLIVTQGDQAVSYNQLSGGERVLASLVTRLLFIASATRLRSVWLDEPLEHLDPVNRVRAAKLLAQACQPGNRLEQIVVTTYEEGLARSMASRYPHVQLLYVSTDPLL